VPNDRLIRLAAPDRRTQPAALSPPIAIWPTLCDFCRFSAIS
jgi:hypothetical protein